MPASLVRRLSTGDSDRLPLTPMDREIERQFVTPARIAAILAMVTVVAAAVYVGPKFGPGRSLTVGSDRVSISEVTFGTFREFIPITGSVVPRTTVYLDAVEGGQILTVHAEEGALVTAGDVLVTLKNTNLQLEVIGREAQLTEQLNSLSGTTLAFEQNRLRNRRELIDIDHLLDSTTRRFQRLKPLVDLGGVTQAEIDDLEADLDYQRRLRVAIVEAQEIDEELQATQIKTLQEAIDAMTRNLEIARENLANLAITAPISGQLSVFEANIGETKGTGQRIGQIDEQDAFKVKAFVDEFYLTRIAAGQTATVVIDGRETRLELVKVYPDVRDRLVEIDLEFTGNSPSLIRRGQTLRMQLDIGRPAETLVLNNGAFFDDTGGSWVFLLNENGNEAERQAVLLGRRSPEAIEILDGLEVGDRVITSGYAQFLESDHLVLDAEE